MKKKAFRDFLDDQFSIMKPNLAYKEFVKKIN